MKAYPGILCLMIGVLFWTQLTYSQTNSLKSEAPVLTQTVRGTVVDADAGFPLPGANVVLVGSDPFIGASTGMDGTFRLENVPVGRHDIQVTFLGYAPRMLSEILVTSGKEAVLTIGLQENMQTMDVVTVEAKRDAKEAGNELSMVSARSFSVEETKRYAGSFQDPARMALSYAGVGQNPSGNNDIIIRGNSPRGLQWRMEGIEIPNPNHFAENGSAGGAISALNADMLANSDFLTGAFTAEYGNAFSGVFDLKLRNGNNEKGEYSFQVGVLGTDLTAEGPLSKNSNASYVANYRYSSLDLLTETGILDFGGNVPKYQDATFNVKIPTESAGIFSVWGIGGKSTIREDFDEEDGTPVSRGDFGSDMGAAGINHHYAFTNRLFLKSTVSLQGARSFYSANSWDSTSADFIFDAKEEFDTYGFRAQTMLNYKPDARLFVRAGATYSGVGYNMYSEWRDYDTDEILTDLNAEGNSGYYQLFGTASYRFNGRLTTNVGMHYIRLSEQGQDSFEPRLSAKYFLNDRHSVHAGFGVHSRHEPIATYQALVYNKQDELGTWNRDIELAKSRHYVLGYTFGINSNTYLKFELYYQDLFDIPIEDSDSSKLSTLNQIDYYTTRLLNNDGTGTNKGLEVTLERMFKDNMYFMITGSLYDSRYVAGDGIERNTQFNGRYATNVLAGREFPLKTKKENKTKTLITDVRFMLAGGYPYTPLDVDASREEGHSVRIDDKYLGEYADDFYRIDLNVGYRIDKKRSSQTLSLDIQNITNRENKIYPYWNDSAQEVEWSTQLGILPSISWQIDF